MSAYKLTYEAIAQLSIIEVCQEQSLPETVQHHLQNPDTDVAQKYEFLFEDKTIEEFIGICLKNTDELGSSTSMSRFWQSFLEMVEILLLNYHALRTRNWNDYVCSLTLDGSI